jgi:hypothetical protein
MIILLTEIEPKIGSDRLIISFIRYLELLICTSGILTRRGRKGPDGPHWELLTIDAPVSKCYFYKANV